MIFELAQDFHDTIEAIPKEHPKHRILALLEEAIQRDVNFIARHRTVLFQCLWNTCWWYDCPSVVNLDGEPKNSRKVGPLGERSAPTLCNLLEEWQVGRRGLSIETPWLKSCTPPFTQLGQPWITFLRGHTGEPICLAFSPDDRLLATGSLDSVTFESPHRDKTVRVWDLSTGQEIACYNGHKYGVLAVTFSPDGKVIASVGAGLYDSHVHLWDPLTSETLAVLDHSAAKTVIHRIEFTPDGEWVVGRDDGYVRLWPAPWNKEGHAFARYGFRLKCGGYGPGIGYKDNLLRPGDFWVNASSGLLRFTLITKGPSFHFELTCGKSDEPLLIYDLSTEGAKLLFNDLLITAEEVNLWWLIQQGIMRFLHGLGVWFATHKSRAPTHKMESVSTKTHSTRLSANSPDGARTAQVFDETPREITVSGIGPGQPVAVLAGHHAPITKLAFSHAGLALASSSKDGTVIAWKLDAVCYQGAELGSATEVISTVEAPGKSLRQVSGGPYLAEFEHDRIIITCRESGKRLCRTNWVPVAYTGNEYKRKKIEALALSSDGQRLVFAQWTRGIIVWNLQKNPPEKYDEDHCAMFSLPDGIRLENPFPDHNLPSELAFSPDGRSIAGASYSDRFSGLWNTETGVLLATRHDYVQPLVMASGPHSFLYRLCVGLSESVLENTITEEVCGWLPLTEEPCSSESDPTEWMMNISGVRQRFALNSGRHGQE